VLQVNSGPVPEAGHGAVVVYSRLRVGRREPPRCVCNAQVPYGAAAHRSDICRGLRPLASGGDGDGVLGISLGVKSLRAAGPVVFMRNMSLTPAAGIACRLPSGIGMKKRPCSARDFFHPSGPTYSFARRLESGESGF